MLHIIAKQSSCISLQHVRSPHSLEGVGRSLDWKGQMPSTDILSDTVLHRKRPKTTFFNILCIYSVMVHGRGTSFISN